MFEQAQTELSTLRDLLRFAVSRFNEAKLFFGHGADNAWDEAAYLLLHSLHLPLERLEPFLDATLTRDERAAVLQVIDRRIRERLPVAYLTNEAWLGEYRFYVDQRVIVPRSFIAELLREQLTPWIDDAHAVTAVLDLCTGSACLAILAAHAFPAARIDAVDISPEALAVARRNVDDYDLAAQIRLVQGDLFVALKGKRYDLIIANPPYVNAASMATLPEEYRREPELALASGLDGLDLTRAILAGARQHLRPNALLVVEIGHNRDALEAAFPATPFTWLDTSAGDQYVFLLHRDELP
ncbi:MAG: 50S ribosomal protein L3 N(5)-glutamine methyltransferase [Candidatus Accumulibacter phosphatis]|uniref:Ribosomal protein uL3 glutamine methyltransferase n=1 Tax=Candidatus Accumulibacter cognatus TaxID=2954383 RepID=A0A080MCB9_9PROT|nr:MULTISPECIES: 50S ribosomal protein L3 N(5)-glutamine methyltransferase [Candidatus Accumulibacter]MCC2866579.1 50S ribosomal protein L3 N(5)-glutamine methyltransferase [Candidatus Accumulibacter phosphatis]KFB78090.1 MAG: 50S ribosomal protein L3 glutamine methyltransferase [Candidatus Accumulibacter cognatus]MBN8518481.1 50S ribosomal protein L3 N(5)-glutamine methyltransferase [Accumulibacter sp.]MBO3709927.1 50S ribosomal protein L3 N(5)-glutamine methyltransferase [Accumulibacter sp.]